MHVNNKKTRSSLNHRVSMFSLGMACLLAGVLYYVNFRSSLPFTLILFQEYLQYLHILGAGSIDLAPAWSYSLPTFLHVSGFVLITLAMLRKPVVRLWSVAIVWLFISVSFEVAQVIGHSALSGKGSVAFIVTSGIFDWYDVAAALIAVLVALSVAHLLGYTSSQAYDNQQKRFAALNYSLLLAVYITGAASIVGSNHLCEGSNGETDCVDPPTNYHDPVYLSYETLRNNSIFVVENSPLTETGKIYVYQSYLLVNTPNQGIHIYDNADPTDPRQVAYINIPGNLDIAVYQGYLYADSYVDLVVFDLRSLDTGFESIQQTHRVEDIFPYDAYQNIPDDIYLKQVDRSKGVVTGYETANKSE